MTDTHAKQKLDKKCLKNCLLTSKAERERRRERLISNCWFKNGHNSHVGVRLRLGARDSIRLSIQVSNVSVRDSNTWAVSHRFRRQIARNKMISRTSRTQNSILIWNAGPQFLCLNLKFKNETVLWETFLIHTSET